MLCVSSGSSRASGLRLGRDRSVLSVGDCQAIAVIDHIAALSNPGPNSESIFNSYIADTFSIPRSCAGLQRLGRNVSFCSPVYVHVVADGTLPKLDVRMARGPEDIHLKVPLRTH
jgi:hypothetical protein